MSYFDPTVSVRVIAEFKRDEIFLPKGSNITFDVFDSNSIAKLVTLYGPEYPYRDFIELPDVSGLPLHIQEQIQATYGNHTPVDAFTFSQDNTTFVERIEESFRPILPSPWEQIITTSSPTIIDSPEVNKPVEKPVTVELEEVKELLEESPDHSEVPIQEIPEVVAAPEVPELDLPTPFFPEEVKTYSDKTNEIIALSRDKLEDVLVGDLKLTLEELGLKYTNKHTAINLILDLPK